MRPRFVFDESSWEGAANASPAGELNDAIEFWWHVKLRPHIDRIHFLYEPPRAGSTERDEGRIVVGLFKDHCILPS